MEGSSEEAAVFEINFWYGIHYPVGDDDHICAALVGTKFAALAGDDRELTIGNNHYLRNKNSDFEVTRGVIIADDMSIHGEDSTDPNTLCKFEPTELTESEEKYSACVETVTDMYDTIVTYYKAKGLPLKNLHLGWVAYNCEWCDDSDESGDESEDKSNNNALTKGVTKGVTKEAKKVPTKDAKPKAQPKAAKAQPVKAAPAKKAKAKPKKK